MLPEMPSQINSDEFVGEVNSISFFTVREEFLVSVSKNKTNLPPKKPQNQPSNPTMRDCNSAEDSTIHELL